MQKKKKIKTNASGSEEGTVLEDKLEIQYEKIPSYLFCKRKSLVSQPMSFRRMKKLKTTKIDKSNLSEKKNISFEKFKIFL